MRILDLQLDMVKKNVPRPTRFKRSRRESQRAGAWQTAMGTQDCPKKDQRGNKSLDQVTPVSENVTSKRARTMSHDGNGKKCKIRER